MERLVLEATMDSLDSVGRFVRDLGESGALTEEQSYKFRLATEEIATNIVTHGYGESEVDLEGEATFALEGAVEDDRVWIRTIDRAPAFDPTSAPEPGDLHVPLAQRRVGGLGIHLARSVLDEFRYERTDGENRTTLVITRTTLPGSAGEDRTADRSRPGSRNG